jgi:heme-degrading monooxygenase HmoA
MSEGRYYTSGRWVVKEGREDKFIGRWREFTEWAAREADGAGSFTLLRQAEAPTHFISFASWASPDAIAAWRGSADFGRYMGACRELCDEFQPTDHTLAATAGG